MKKLVTIVFAILSFFFYQTATKYVPQDMNAFVSLFISYVVIMILGIAGFFVIPAGCDRTFSQMGREFKGVLLSGAILGVFCVGLDLGNIFAYRFGWAISVAPLFQVGLGSVFLLLISVFFYKEKFTLRKLLGLCCILGGLFMISLA